MSEQDRVTVEPFVRVRIPRHELLVDLTLDEANDLLMGLRDSWKWTPPSPLGDGFLCPRIPITMTDEGLDRLKSDIDMAKGIAKHFPNSVNETGPTLQDDIEAAIAKQGLVAESITTGTYWDCNCERDYIHPRNLLNCGVCGARREDQPDSRVSEVAEYLRDKPYSRMVADHIAEAGELVDKPRCEVCEAIIINRSGWCGVCGVKGDVAANDTSPERVDETGENTDDADEQEQEFLSRLPHVPQDGRSRAHLYNQPCKLMPVEPQPETREERPDSRPVGDSDPVVEADTSHVSKGKGGRTGETDAEKAVRLWRMYAERYPDRTPNARVALVHGHMPKLTVPEVRELLRANGVEIPDPNTRAQNAANARHTRVARIREEQEGKPLVGIDRKASTENPEILTDKPDATADQCERAVIEALIEKHTDEPLVDRFPPLLTALPFDDARALFFEFLETQTTEIPSLYTSRAGVEACTAHRAQIRALQGEFMALAGFEKRELKEKLQQRWRECVKGTA